MSEAKKFTIYPAIDIRGGQCVNLYQGDYAQETVYGHPLDMAQKWVEQGADWIHLVDLDGAKEGKPVNHKLVVEISKEVPVPVQIGGGIRDIRQVDTYINQGIQRVILGTSAIKNPQFVKEALKEFGSYIAIGLDARDGYVATEGWLKASEIKTEELALRLADQGAETFIFTDISKDGTLTGPNLEATLKLAERVGKEVIASGGVSTLKDLQELSRFTSSGVAGAIVGKALYQSVFSLKEAIGSVEATS
jgi:phosphoribosylformimino-5-aminoimidazole carboxamide ribotide isomerase